MVAILEARNLGKSFGGFRALHDVSLSVEEGEIHALIGPNGAGKTTLFNLLTRFTEPSSGQIFYRGREITRLPAHDVALLGIVRSFQISSVFPELSVIENIWVALQRPAGLGHRFWVGDHVLQRFDHRVSELLLEVGLDSDPAAPAGQLPYGQKRALEIATTLALDPQVLLLDEPMAGLGRESIEVVSELIRRVARNRTIVMVEHNLGVIEKLCDTVTVLQRGQILVEGDYASVASDERVINAYIGPGLSDLNGE